MLSLHCVALWVSHRRICNNVYTFITAFFTHAFSRVLRFFLECTCDGWGMFENGSGFIFMDMVMLLDQKKMQ